MPRIGTDKPQEEKLIHGSSADHLEQHCAGELLDAVEKKDVKAFRSAFEALIMNCFETEGESDERNAS